MSVNVYDEIKNKISKIIGKNIVLFWQDEPKNKETNQCTIYLDATYSKEQNGYYAKGNIFWKDDVCGNGFTQSVLENTENAEGQWSDTFSDFFNGSGRFVQMDFNGLFIESSKGLLIKEIDYNFSKKLGGKNE